MHDAVPDDRSKSSGTPNANIDSYVRQLEWLRAISQRLTETRSLAEALDAVYDGVRSGLGYDRVGINLFDYEAGTFEDLIGTDAAGNKYIPTNRRVELHSDSPIWSFPGIAAMLRGDPYYFTEDAAAECPPELIYLFDGPPKHNIMVPLRVGEQVSGMISVDNLPSGRPIERREVDALLSVAGQVSRAVENARLLEALRQSAASFRLLFEDNPLPMWVYDLETLAFLEVNDAAVAEYGYTRDQFLSMQIIDVRPEEDVDRLLKEIQASYPMAQDSREWRHRLADGTVIDVEISSHSLTFEERPAAIVVARNVTQHKRDTQSLAEAEIRYRALVEQIPAVVYRSGPDLSDDASYISPSAETLLGCTAEEFLSTPGSWQSFIHPDDRASVLAANEVSNDTSEPFAMEYRVVALGGQVKWVRDEGICIRDAQGRPLYWQGFWLDVTEQRRAADRLEVSESRFRSTFQHAPIGMALVHPDGRWIEANAALCSIVGYTQDELLERSFQDITHPEDLDTDLANVEQMLAGEIEFYQMEKRYIHKDGRVVWVLLSVSLSRAADGEPLYFISQVEDISERRHIQNELRRQALHDALTGLPNRTLFGDRISQAIALARRSSSHVALMLLDLDRFKDVNDTLGHGAGDSVLTQIAGRLQMSLRATDTLARLGGDEFAIVLPEATQGSAEHIAVKIERVLTDPVMLEGHRVTLDASIGIAVFPQHGDTVPALVRHADLAMYEAKRAGTRHFVYDDSLEQAQGSRLSLVEDLRQAIHRGQIVPYFQPLVDMRSGEILHVEALARWTHPERGFVSPSDFIPLAEDTGLIEPLTALVLKSALARCALWRKQGREMSVSVNLSVRSLRDEKLPDILEQTIRSTKTEPSALIIELTESILIEDPQRAISLLKRISQMGVRIAVDDFGTGYSSLAYLGQLPVHLLKIDRSFVGSIAEAGTAIVHSTIDLGHSLGLQVVAEGVEDWPTWDVLAKLGCDIAQGYFLSRAIPGEQFLAWADEFDRTTSLGDTVVPTVLLVDDHPVYLRLLEVMFRHQAWNLITASSAEEALDRVESANPDVVVTDIRLGGMDGLELTTQIRSSKGRDRPAIIAITGEPTHEERARALAMGCDVYVGKPADNDELGRLVADQVSRMRQRVVRT
jgi:diguanylate cyclase (GGDEF)-like protein/PAS domain S-box-containing protein